MRFVWKRFLFEVRVSGIGFCLGNLKIVMLLSGISGVIGSEKYIQAVLFRDQSSTQNEEKETQTG